MKTAADYRQNAQDCRDLANRARDASERVVLLRMAETWDKLANDWIAIAPQRPAPEPEPAS